MNIVQSFSENLEKLLEASKREANDTCLIVASKYFSAEQILKLYEMGQRDFGENRVQDALLKMQSLPADITWHLIGHLQKKKVNKVVDQFEYIHSVDSLELAQKISERSSKKQKIFAQVNTSNEPSKEGFSKEDFLQSYSKLESFKNIELVGLMTMAPLTDDQNVIRSCFRDLKEISKTLNRAHWKLSMGMSSDYPIAIEEGAHFIRIGRHFLKGL